MQRENIHTLLRLSTLKNLHVGFCLFSLLVLDLNPTLTLLIKRILIVVRFAAPFSSQLNTECNESQADKEDVHEEGTLNVIEDQSHIGRVRSWLVELLFRGSAIMKVEA